MFGPGAIPIGESCARALELLGCEVLRFDARIEHPMQPAIKPLRRALGVQRRPGSGPPWLRRFDALRVRSSALKAAAHQFRPDLLLVLRGNHFERDLLEELRRDLGLRTAAWWLYGPEEAHELPGDVARYQTYFTMYPSGLPGVHLLPALAIDPTQFNPDGPREPFLYDISFIGRNSARRDRVLSALVDLPLSIWGAGWRKPADGWRPALWRHVRGRGVWGDGLAGIYRRSRIVLDVNVWEADGQAPNNQRLFDVPACGGFLLTEPSVALNTYFDPDREMATWRSEAELRERLLHHLDHPEEREAMARAALARTRNLPTYVDRMRELLEVVGA